jgi:two-component system CheB/CheR fusion protein
MVEDDDGFESLLEYLRDSRAFDFTGYKRASLRRRVIKRMEAVGISDFPAYLDHLQVHPTELTHLFDYILINVTGFFRDPGIWDHLGSVVIPRIVEDKKPEDPIRAWCAGVATGEEAYSVAMLFAEHLGNEAFTERVKIYATDVDEDALAAARQASYTPKEIEPVPPELQERYFQEADGRYVFDRELRRTIVFGRHDLVHDAPISQIDLLVCRNTLMYFTSETQARILARFHFALNEGGFLLLGKAEMLFTRPPSLQPVDLRRRVFTKVGGVGDLRDELMAATHVGDHETVGRLATHVRSREVAFEGGPVAQFLVDRRGYLTMANLQARVLFGVSTQDVGRPLSDLEVSYRPVDLRSAIDEVVATRSTVLRSDVPWTSPEGDRLHLDVELVPMADRSGTLLGVSVSFLDVTRYRELQRALEHSNQELQTAMEELHSTNEELETTNEELHSTNEELETTNEELQSTNEELETMNEELQSSNEEMQAVNEELRDRTGELNELNAYLGSILRSIQAAVIVVDRDLRIRMWNHQAEEMWGLRSDEVTGELLPRLDIGLPVRQLEGKLAAVLSGSSAFAETMVDAVNRRGRSIRVRITGSRFHDPDGAVNGAVVLIEEAPHPGPGVQDGPDPRV